MGDKVLMQIGSQIFMLYLFYNVTCRTFREWLSLTVSTEDVNAKEKSYRFAQSVTLADATTGTIRKGELYIGW